MPLWDDRLVWLLEWVGPLIATAIFTIAAIATSANNWVSV